MMLADAPRLLPSEVADGTASARCSAAAKNPVLAIAICTYRRPLLLAKTLNGIAELTFPPGRRPALHVIVADNEGDPTVQREVEAFAARTDLPTTYVIEHRRGISQARNACLEAVPEAAEFVAFIDDDETPGPGWLSTLLATQSRTRAAVVCGPVGARFETIPPAWIVEGGFFEQPRRADGSLEDMPDGAPIVDAATGNTLVRMAEIRRLELRFDNRFGMTGGEDALFFRQLRAAGAKMVWSPGAEVVEHIPSARARFAYLAREYFRCGSVRTAIDALDSRATPGTAAPLGFCASTLKKIGRKTVVHATLLTQAVVSGRARARVYFHIFEIANAAGRLSALLGFRYEHYR